MDYVEVLKESRKISVTQTSTEQTISLRFQLPEQSTDGQFEFLGDDLDAQALQYAHGLFPLFRLLPNYSGEPLALVLSNIELEEVNNYGWWAATAKYKFDLNEGFSGIPDPGSEPADSLNFIRINFTLGGRTGIITESLAAPGYPIVHNYIGTDRPNPENERTIGATQDSVEGAEILVGGLQLMITVFYYPQVAYSMTFIRDRLTACYKHWNSGPFFAFAPGEVLLTEVTGGGTLGEIVPITFTFDIKPNLTAYNDGHFPALTCLGHDLFDYRYYESIDANAETRTMRPEHRIIHRVYEPANFALLGIPGSSP